MMTEITKAMAQSWDITTEAPTDSYMTAEELAEETKGIRMEYPRIQIPNGGVTMFQLPNPNNPDEPLFEKELRCVIMHHHMVNTLWPEGDEESIPLCSAALGEVGAGSPGGICENCPYNKFGSNGKGKACKNSRRLYVMRPGDTIPHLLILPATSLPGFDKFLSNSIIMAKQRLTSCVVDISLIAKENDSKQRYSVAAFKVHGWLQGQQALQMAVMRDDMRRVLSANALQNATPYTGDDDEENAPF